VRTREEFDNGHLAGSVNIPVDSIRQRIGEIPKDKKIILYCKIGLRGYIAYRILVQKGFRDVWNLSGGYELYMAQQYQYGQSIDLNEHMTKFEFPKEMKNIQGKPSYS
jgi:rhodanese-related sulfurtransferase